MTQKTPSPGSLSRFGLTRWFGVVSMAAITVIAAASVWLLSWFVTQRMLLQEATLTRDFVHSLMLVETALQDYVVNPQDPPAPDVVESFQHLARMPDMLRANLYDLQRRVLWSSDQSLIGRRFGPNDELDLALRGAVVVEKKTQEERVHGKSEYEALTQPDDLFVEIYVPVTESRSGRVIGAIEFYKNPRGLMLLLAQLRHFIALGAIGFGLLLFAALFGLVRRADGLIQAQQQQLVDNETFAVVGEMSSVVAHGIRNPLAAMRSSAELIVDSASGPPRPDDARATKEAAQDIVEQADRMGAWVRELLSYTRSAEGSAQPLSVAPLVQSCLQEFDRELERRHVRARAELATDLPAVRGDALFVGQVLRSVLANALDAVQDGGRITVSAAPDKRRRLLTLRVQDNGRGMSRAQRAQAGSPFFTTKANGMGVGLSLARRVLERHGGRLHIASEEGKGTVVSISLRLASSF